MFGFGKNKQKQKDEQFYSELSQLSSSFAYHADILDEQQIRELLETVITVYLQRAPEEEHFKSSDFFFDLLIGNLANSTIDDILDPHTSLQMWKRTDKYFLAFPENNTNVAQRGMKNWKAILIDRKIDPINFEFMI